MMYWVVKLFLYLLLAFAVLSHAQDQSGFISIDCGIPDNSSYTDVTTGIDYFSDVGYVETGVSKSISPLYMTNGLEQQFSNVRSFPEGIKNCYTITPPQIQNKTRYFVRAGFMYGNYDNKNQLPKFDIYLGVDYWDTVEFLDQSSAVSKEILYNPSSNYTYVCMVNTDNGTPFISVLELRLVDDNIYTAQNGSSLVVFGRWDLRSYDNKKIIRYGDDSFDRVWEPSFFRYRSMEINTTLSINNKNRYIIPSIVLSNAVTPQNVNESLDFYWKPSDPTTKYFIYFHFADFQSTQIREFNVTVNGEYFFGPFQPNYLAVTTVYTIDSLTPATWFNFSFFKTNSSELPPMINAMEIYFERDLLNPQTNQQDVDAIKSIKFTYGVKKNWQGDPCIPKNFSWLGLNCFYDSPDIPRIRSLNLSFSGLTGTISPSIENLNMLQYLDLSNNTLTGEVPKFLSQMQKLSVLNLSGNNLTGIIPSELVKRSTDGSLTLSVDGNPFLCASESCETRKNNTTPPPSPATPTPATTKDTTKNNDHLVPIIAGAAAVIVLVILLGFLIIIILIKKMKLSQQQDTSN